MEQQGFDPTRSNPERSWTSLLIAAAVLVFAVSITGVVTLTRFGLGDSSESTASREEPSLAGSDAPSGPETESETSAPGPETESSTSTEPPVSEPSTVTVEPIGGDGVLTYGSLLPQTGNLAFLGPPMEAGAELAIADINEAGGVFGSPVRWLEGDSGSEPSVASATVDQHLDAGVDALIGAASSRVSLSVIDRLADSGAVQISPSNTATELTNADDGGRYFRVAPSDVLQGRVLAEVMLADGASTAAFLVLDDPYGTDLLAFATERYEEIGGRVTAAEIYDPGADNFEDEIATVVASEPDAIVIIGFDRTATLLDSLVARGVGPGDKLIYGTDGNMGTYLATQVADPSSLAGMRGTLPGVDVAALHPDFVRRLEGTSNGAQLEEYSYSTETYDAIVTVALAALAAEIDDPDAIAQQIPSVTDGGTRCTSFAECADLIASGADIDYDGLSGPLAIDDSGDPEQASILVLEFDAAGELFIADSVVGSQS